jgi:transposase InsO family protein
MRTELIEDAVTAARDTGGSLAGAVFHSDHGSQTRRRTSRSSARALGVTQSMGAVGTPFVQ